MGKKLPCDPGSIKIHLDAAKAGRDMAVKYGDRKLIVLYKKKVAALTKRLVACRIKNDDKE